MLPPVSLFDPLCPHIETSTLLEVPTFFVPMTVSGGASTDLISRLFVGFSQLTWL